MKKFLFNTTLFLVGAVLITQLLAFVVINLQPNDIADYQSQINQLLEQSSEIEIITIGNSHNYSIDFNQFDQKGYHLWRPLGDFFEIQYQLENLLPKLPNNKTVLIPISYFAFHDDLGAREETKQQRAWKYAAIESWNLFEGEIKYFVLGKIHSILPIDTLVRADHWNPVFLAMFDKSFRTANTERAEDGQRLLGKYVKCEHLELEELITHTKDIGVPFHLDIQNEGLANHPNLTRDTYEAAVNIIEYLQARDIRIVFYTPPYFEKYTELYDRETVELMKRNMEQLQQEYNIEYYDFSTDPEFIHNHRLFYDDDHLNLCGAKRFSAKFNKILSENAP